MKKFLAILVSCFIAYSAQAVQIVGLSHRSDIPWYTPTVGVLYGIDALHELDSSYAGVGPYIEWSVISANDGFGQINLGLYSFLCAKNENENDVVQPFVSFSLLFGEILNLPKYIPLEVGMYIALPVEYQGGGFQLGLVRFAW